MREECELIRGNLLGKNGIYPLQWDKKTSIAYIKHSLYR